MEEFIKETLNKAKTTNKINASYINDLGDKIVMAGSVIEGLATFTIDRIKSNDHKCSSLPVFGMPLSDYTIEIIAMRAVEAL